MTDLNNPSAGSQGPETLEGETKTLVTLAHILGILFPALPAYLILTLKKDQFPGIEAQCKEAFNFQLTAFIITVVSVITCVGPAIVGLATIVFLIIAAVTTNGGKPYIYPWKINFLK
jgi:uncharacterized Tic20 family protein